MLIGLGHDIQNLSEFDRAGNIQESCAFFTSEECAYSRHAASPTKSLAAMFAAKEAFFKACPVQRNFSWTDLEVVRDFCGAPSFTFHSDLASAFREKRWRAYVSISHSGDYVSAVVILSGEDA